MLLLIIGISSWHSLCTSFSDSPFRVSGLIVSLRWVTEAFSTSALAHFSTTDCNAFFSGVVLSNSPMAFSYRPRCIALVMPSFPDSWCWTCTALALPGVPRTLTFPPRCPWVRGVLGVLDVRGRPARRGTRCVRGVDLGDPCGVEARDPSGVEAREPSAVDGEEPSNNTSSWISIQSS